jgi:transcriptional regulator GlxA family with amidase domain
MLKGSVPIPRTIVLVAFDGCQALDVTGPWEVFAQARDRVGQADDAGQRPAYDLVLASPNGGTVATTSGLQLGCTVTLASLAERIDTVLVAGGGRESVDRLASDPGLLDWLRSCAGRARRVGGVCTGAFALAAAGLLDGRRATTHWESCMRLAATYPAISVEADALFVADPPFYTSAGVSAGIDLALALVEADLGRSIALAVARELVLFLRRPGGQSQFSAGLEAQMGASDRMRDLVAWMTGHPEADLDVRALAIRVSMSERNFARVFRGETGQTPARFAEAIRVERAKSHLEDADWPLARLAERCGFGSVDSLHRAFRRRLGITPRDYRMRFSPLGCNQAISAPVMICKRVVAAP